jgi:hypothetical protein
MYSSATSPTIGFGGRWVGVVELRPGIVVPRVLLPVWYMDSWLFAWLAAMAEPVRTPVLVLNVVGPVVYGQIV